MAFSKEGFAWAAAPACLKGHLNARLISCILMCLRVDARRQEGISDCAN